MRRDVAQLREALGRQLAASRRAAGLSQRALAPLVLRDRTTVSKIEAGQRVADATFWRTADDHCQAGGALLTTFAQLCAAERVLEVQDQEARRARAETEIAKLQAEVVALVPDGGGDRPAPIWNDDPEASDARALMSKLVRLADSVDRRTLMGLLRSLCLAAGLPMPTWESDEQERVTRVVGGRRRLDAQVIDIIEKTWECVKRQEDALGPAAVQRTALAHRDMIVSQLPECPAPLRSRLLAAYADVSISLAFYAFDRGDSARAQRHCEAARAAAHEAEDQEMAAYALCNIAYFASIEGGKPHIVLDAASAAHRLVSGSDDPPLRAFVLEKVAAGHALTGGYKACASTLDQAKRTLSVGPGAPRSPAYWYDEGTLVGEESICLLRCGRPREAAESATTGLRLLGENFVGFQAFGAVQLSHARVTLGEIEEATEVLGDAADLATLHRSARLEGAIHAARDRMIPWHATRSVKNLDERLTSCGLWISGTREYSTEK